MFSARSKLLAAMLDGLPVNVMTCDLKTFKIDYANRTSVETLRGLERKVPVKADALVGTCIDVFHRNPAHQRAILSDPNRLPFNAKIKLSDRRRSTCGSRRSGTGAGPIWRRC